MSHAQKNPDGPEAWLGALVILGFFAGYIKTSLFLSTDIPPANRTILSLLGGIVGVIATVILATVTKPLWHRDDD